MRYAVIFCFVLCGCFSQKQAQKQFGRAVSTFPEIGADYCARTYPVVAKTDSSDYLASKRAIDSLALAIKNDSILSNQEREGLLIEIQRIRNSIPGPKDCDSLYDALYLLIAKQTARNDRLEIANRNLLLATNNLKPVHDTVINRAELDKCDIERGKALTIATEKTKESDKWRKIARIRFWIILKSLPN